MNANIFTQLALYMVLLIGLSWPIGIYIARVYGHEKVWGLDAILGPIERFIYRVCGVDPKSEMNWKTYAIALLLFNLVGFIAVYLMLRLQHWLPFNPQGMGAVKADTAFNIASSFATNTNWQNYGGETTLSYGVQMLALTVQNFVSAATGMASLIPIIRAIKRRETDAIGNFWVDLTRGTLYILLPLSIIFAVFLVQQGSVQTLSPYAQVTNLESGHTQTLAVGPAASQIAIKQLGTNGGGFFNVNSSHPFENPTPLSNLFEVLAILLLSGGLCITFGKMVGDNRQGWALLAAMTIILVLALAPTVWSEQRGNPRLTQAGASQIAMESTPADPLSAQPGGNMEGKEMRFGIANSALWAIATTGASNGSVNAMHDSFTPLGGLFPMLMIQLGEVIFGGVGSGLYGMLLFVILTVFIAGLMVGRTPEYLGKKIGPFEMKMASLAILVPPILVLGATAWGVLVPAALASRANPGAHGFSEILYAFSSMGNNNGSAFGGLAVDTPFYNLLGGVVMLFARYWVALPALAIAGSLARKRSVAISVGTLPTHTPLFVILLIAIVILVGVLTFLPALALGPIVEHLQMLQ